MDNIFRKQIEPLDIIRDYQDKEPPELPKGWKPPEPPNNWKPPEVIKPSVSSSKIPAEAYVKTIPREAFYKEELYKRICCVNVTECS